MNIPDDGLVGRSFYAALDYIMSLPSPEDQARALLRRSELLDTPRGTALMKKIASPTTPCCKKLYDILQARDEERANRKAPSARRKARAKGVGIILPNLFDVFGLPQPSDDID